MDVAASRPYVPERMNLLLLLSAMLTALSGAGLGIRAPQVPVAVNSVVTVAVGAQAAVVSSVGRPVAAMPPLGAVSRASIATCWRLTPAAPLYLSRRRE